METETQEKLPGTVKQRRGKEQHPNSLKNLRPFKPGQSGNPAGAKPGPKLKHLLAERLDTQRPNDPHGRTWREVLIDSILELHVVGNSTAINQIWDRLEGKIPLPLHHSGANSEPTEIDVEKAHEKLLDHMRRYNKAKERRKLRAGNPPPQGKR